MKAIFTIANDIQDTSISLLSACNTAVIWKIASYAHFQHIQQVAEKIGQIISHLFTCNDCSWNMLGDVPLIAYFTGTIKPSGS